MRAFVVSLIAVLALVAGCGDDTQQVDSAGDASDSLSGRTFVVQSVEGYEPVPDTEIRITFETDQVKAHAGCNHLFGELTSVDGGVLTVAGMGGTEMGCDPARHDQDTWVAEFLSSSPTWTVDGNELRLANDTAELVLLDRVVADPDRALEGTRWEVDSVIFGPGPDGAVSSTPAGADAHIIFSDGQFEGSAGCNSMWGRYTLQDGDIIITEIAKTAAGCLDPQLASLEEHVANVLSGRVGYQIVASRLTLTGSDGSGLGLRTED